MKVFFSAGEASGDLYAARLLTEIERLLPDEQLRFEAIGGWRLQRVGATLKADSSSWGAISVTESLRVAPKAFTAYREAAKRFATQSPGLFIPVDFGAMNVRLARHAKKAGWKVLYFIPPGSWRRNQQGVDIPNVTDAVVTPFEWSQQLLKAMGANALWFGHPLKQIIAESDPLPDPDSRTTLAILPGSRRHEVNLNLPVIAEAVAKLDPDLRLEFGVAPSIPTTDLESRWKKLSKDRKAKFTRSDTAGVLGRARAGIICSGTATLEAALRDCPLVVIYRVSRIAELEAVVRSFDVGFISLPNIILDKRLVPELIQRDANPDRIAGEIRELLKEGPVRDAQLAGFGEIGELLGPSDGITKAAELAVEMLQAQGAVAAP